MIGKSVRRETRAKLAVAALAFAAVGLPAVAAFAVAPDASVELTAEQVEKARGLFNENGCNACHALADAEASGAVGPALDGNPNLDKAFVVDRITNGAGPMPGFGWLEPADIDLIADYIVQVKK